MKRGISIASRHRVIDDAISSLVGIAFGFVNSIGKYLTPNTTLWLKVSKLPMIDISPRTLISLRDSLLCLVMTPRYITTIKVAVVKMPLLNMFIKYTLNHSGNFWSYPRLKYITTAPHHTYMPR